jgi:hypothetical protein
MAARGAVDGSPSTSKLMVTGNSFCVGRWTLTPTATCRGQRGRPGPHDDVPDAGEVTAMSYGGVVTTP